MPGISTKSLPYTDYYLTTRRDKNSEWKNELENNTNKLHYIKPHNEGWENVHNSCRQFEIKLSRFHIGHTTLHPLKCFGPQKGSYFLACFDPHKRFHSLQRGSGPLWGLIPFAKFIIPLLKPWSENEYTTRHFSIYFRNEKYKKL